MKYGTVPYNRSCQANFNFTSYQSIIIRILHDAKMKLTFLTITGTSTYEIQTSLKSVTFIINMCQYGENFMKCKEK
jgi:hypothetical protein